MNNFMDGISIGAGYAYLRSTGLKLTTAILFEEYTHKLGKQPISFQHILIWSNLEPTYTLKITSLFHIAGDFAIVFQSGIPMKRVLFWNYITSCACFLGIIIGIALGNLNWSKYIFSFATGLFLYIALSNMVSGGTFWITFCWIIMGNVDIGSLLLSLNLSKKLFALKLEAQYSGNQYQCIYLSIWK